MQKANKQATVAANATNVVAQQVIAAQATYPVVTNAQRRVRNRAVALLAVRAARNAKRAQQRNQQAYMLQVAQLAVQYGVQAPQFGAVVAANARANSATVAPSRELVVVNGVGYKPCKAVHALCALLPADATRAQQLEICKDNGINAATASTQVGIYRKAAAAAAAAE